MKKIILGTLLIAFLSISFIGQADAKVDYCKVRNLNGTWTKYVRQTGWVCPNWKYIKCKINGQNMWFIGGIKGESFTNSCPTSISNTQPN